MFAGKSARRGFTLAECLTAVVILSVGIVFLYRALLHTMDLEDYLSHRLYAGQWLQDQADFLTGQASVKKNVPQDSLSAKSLVTIRNRLLEFSFQADVLEFKDLKDLAGFSTTVLWNERGRTIRLPQTIYVLQPLDE